MMILSCGHREDNFDKHYTVTTKEWENNSKAVAYSCVCLHCYLDLQREKRLFYSDSAALEWLME